MRKLLIGLMSAALFVAGCGSDEAGSPTSTTAAEETTTSSTTTESVDAEEAWTSPQPAIDMCEALATRDGATVAAELSDTAEAGDHTTGERFFGPDEVAAWVDSAEVFAEFELTACAGDGLGASWWSGATFAFSSDTNPGGAEGMVLVQPRDGGIAQLQLVYTLSDDETSVADEVSEADREILTAWCESFGALDPAEVEALATEDVTLTSGRNAERVRLGAEGIESIIFLLENDPEDTMECSEQAIANGGLLATPFRWVVTEDPAILGRGFGGIWVVETTEGGLVDSATFFGQTMTEDGILYDVSQDPETGEVTILNPEVLEDE